MVSKILLIKLGRISSPRYTKTTRLLFSAQFNVPETIIACFGEITMTKKPLIRLCTFGGGGRLTSHQYTLPGTITYPFTARHP